MVDFYKYETTQGIIIPDTADVKTEVENEFYSNFGGDMDLQESTPQGRLVEMETLSRVGVVGICALVANQINLDYATGQFLDAIGAFYGVERKGATHTRVLATLTGVSGTIIQAGAFAKTTVGDLFYLENTTEIPASGSITAYFLSSEYGAIPCATGTLTQIISQTIGWETVSNPASASVGSDMESDFDYKKRIKNARYTGSSLLESIKSNLQLVDNVKSSFVYDNGTGSAITYDGVSIDAHSLLVVVDGGTDSDIAKAIFDKKSAGCGYTAISGQSTTVGAIDGAYGVSYNVIFNRPSVLNIDVSVDVRQNEYTGTDLQGDVKNAVLNWANGGVENVDGLKIGQNVSPFEIASAISEQMPSIYVKRVRVCVHGGSLSTNELTCTIAQVYAVSESNISVNVV